MPWTVGNRGVFREACSGYFRPRETPFEQMKRYQEATGRGAYAPFADHDKWALAQWLIKNVNQRATEEFLKLVHIHGDLGPLDENNVVMEGIQDGETKELELWMCDPVACIRELMGNPAFDGSMVYAPEKVYTDTEGRTHQYDEMWTADWWWDMQTRLPAGVTIAPVILASDKTELSRFKGDKTAWPVYLTIGNISKEVRREPSSHASVLLGYLPVLKLASFENNSVAGYCLFHYCMALLLKPLVAAGEQGVEMVGANGYVCWVFPILAAFIGDHPEQCLVACCTENRCPKCLVPPSERGQNAQFPRRSQTRTKQTLHAQATNEYPPEFIAEGLCPVFSPFWAELPHTDIFLCITSNILHQLHQGIIKDHLKRWCSVLAETAQLNARFHAMPILPRLCHFKKGVFTIKQWTAGDHKQFERVFIGALVGTDAEPRVQQAACSLVDFVHLAEYCSHTDDILAVLQNALDNFHCLKDVFIELRCWNHFNIPKFHSLVYYTDTIQTLGSLDGLNTETSERLHIDFAKKAYAATNRKDYTVQMTRWLQRQEAVIWFSSYQTWRRRTGLLDSEHSLSSDSEGHRPDQYRHEPHVAQPSRYQISRQPRFPKKTIQYLAQYHGAQLEHVADVNSRIRSHPERFNGVCKPPTLARFDTILMDRRGGLYGLCMAEVCAIFRLPSHLGNYPHPLAYIHWFKPLQTYDDNTKMFCISRSMRHTGYITDST
ncbi:hypothetical protein HD554DRAFT_2206981 [Boletus coccyginus]|nr:hypothetical protein HD554DRAFT_2206981 [Boletus coccyginus]